MSTNSGECNCAAAKRKIVGDIYTPEIWGPIYWKYLHIFGSRLSKISNRMLLKQSIEYFDALFEILQYAIPCSYCQQHYITYYNAKKLQNLKDMNVFDAISKIKEWLFTFHNDIRQNKGKPVIINTIQEYNAHYASMTLEACDNDILMGSLKYGLQATFITLENYTKFMRIVAEMRRIIKV